MIGTNTIQSRGLLIHRGFPIKAYPFAEYFDRLYGTTEEALREISASLSGPGISVPNVLTGIRALPQPLYAISYPWGYIEHGGPVRKVDFYGFIFDREWDKCNPEWDPYIFKNGVLQPDDTKGCETGLLILGMEGNLRRTIAANGGDLERYLQQWADLGYLGPANQRIAHLEIKS